MRYAIVSDIHANLQAWKAVLRDIRSLGADRIICLGDIVGYGPNPREVLQSVESHVDFIVLGNHDAVACGKISSAEFYDEAKQIINWTTEQLSERAKYFLGSLPLTLAGSTFRCAHGDFSNPGAFNYIIEPKEALPSWNTVSEQLLFVGHTHEPTIHVLGQSGVPHLVKAQDFVLEPGKRYIVNAGSVGQPRDKDARASYCIYDTASNFVMWRRVQFNIDKFRAALKAAGISEKPSTFLREAEIPSVMDMVNLAPAVTDEKSVRDAVQVQQLTNLRRRLKIWKILFGIAVVCGISAAAAIGLFWLNAKDHHLTIPDPAAITINSTIFQANTNMLMAPLASVPAGSAIPGWNIELGDKAQQHIGFEADNPDGHVFVLSSASDKDELSLVSPPIIVEPHSKMCFEVVARKSSEFAGNFTIAVSVVTRKKGREESINPYAVKTPTQIKSGSWMLAKDTFAIPANAVSISLRIGGKFTGNVFVKDISLENRN